MQHAQIFPSPYFLLEKVGQTKRCKVKKNTHTICTARKLVRKSIYNQIIDTRNGRMKIKNDLRLEKQIRVENAHKSE